MSIPDQVIINNTSYDERINIVTKFKKIISVGNNGTSFLAPKKTAIDDSGNHIHNIVLNTNEIQRDGQLLNSITVHEGILPNSIGNDKKYTFLDINECVDKSKLTIDTLENDEYYHVSTNKLIFLLLKEIQYIQNHLGI